MRRKVREGALNVQTYGTEAGALVPAVSNWLILINSFLTERTVERQRLWQRLKLEDFRGLTQLLHRHINLYGDFASDFPRPSFLAAAGERVIRALGYSGLLVHIAATLVLPHLELAQVCQEMLFLGTPYLLHILFTIDKSIT